MIFIKDAHTTEALNFPQGTVFVFLKRAWVRLARNAVLADGDRFKEGSELKVVFLGDRIVFVIMSMGAVER